MRETKTPPPPFFDLVPYAGTLMEGTEEGTYIVLTATTQRRHNWHLRCVPISWKYTCIQLETTFTRGLLHTPSLKNIKWSGLFFFLKPPKSFGPWSYAGKQWASIPGPSAVASVWPVRPRLDLSPACSCSRWIHPEVKLYRTTEADHEYIWRAPSVMLCGLDGFKLSSEGWCLRHYRNHIVASKEIIGSLYVGSW